MKLHLIIALCLAATASAQTLANKGKLIFSDDFSAPEVGKAWRAQWPALAITDGVLNIS
jgi:hypothetical protein